MLNDDYHNYLNALLLNEPIDSKYQNLLTFDMYLTLISLNNKQYKASYYQNEINILEDFLRKVNNLKVKIQLKRKENEIDELLANIKAIYKDNSFLIEKYNEEKIPLVSTIETKNPTDITTIIDKLTKTKMTSLAKKLDNDKIRDEIINNIYTTDFYLNDDTFNMADISLSLSEFYHIFDYLLDINNYQNITNPWKLNYINSVIESINNGTKLTDYLIIILTVLFVNNNLNGEGINTNKFNIENIKISELYQFANNETSNPETNAKWKKIVIPNDYLYQKIKLIVSTGSYYYQNNIFVMELINDFKISILTEDLSNFLKENISKIIV